MTKLIPQNIKISEETEISFRVNWTTSAELTGHLNFTVTAVNSENATVTSCSMIVSQLEAYCSNLVPGVQYNVTVTAKFGQYEDADGVVGSTCEYSSKHLSDVFLVFVIFFKEVKTTYLICFSGLALYVSAREGLGTKVKFVAQSSKYYKLLIICLWFVFMLFLNDSYQQSEFKTSQIT